ncbi:MAG: VCBS repeat-containing protein, partial [Rhodobacteraceae bacterium]|nr:VCBS repeat-containing protein [Paracoccaceae bacterium]
MRGAALAVCLTIGATAAFADITGARYADPTRRYDHGILGDEVEYGTLVISTTKGRVRLKLPQTRVFEDTEPRLADVDGDGAPEV